MAIKWLIKGVDSKGKSRSKGNPSKKGKKGKGSPPVDDGFMAEADAPPAQFHKDKKKRAPRNGAETKAKRNKQAK